MDSSKGFHRHTKPSWAVKDGVWGVERGSKSLSLAVDHIKGGTSVVSVRDGFRSEWCGDVDGGNEFVFDKCDQKVVGVWENGRNVNGREGEMVIYWIGTGSGR